MLLAFLERVPKIDISPNPISYLLFVFMEDRPLRPLLEFDVDDAFIETFKKVIVDEEYSIAAVRARANKERRDNDKTTSTSINTPKTGSVKK